MIKAIIVDDEFNCCETLATLLERYCPTVTVATTCYSGEDALPVIEQEKPQIVFLDIEMPRMNGFEMLEKLPEIHFEIIFTTGYDQYAIKAIRFSALDYLLKPIDPKELIAAVHKVQLQKAPPSEEQFRLLMDQIQGKETGLSKIAALLNQNLSYQNPTSLQRRLAAILFTDIVGYTAMMQHNEADSLTTIKRYTAVLKQTVKDHAGEVANDYGDGNLCVFASASEAVQCALEMQQQLQAEPVIPLRIGLHIGEIFFEDGKILGDGVNVASRIQSLASGNCILFSEEIQDKIKNNTKFRTVCLGSFDFQNVKKPIVVFALANEGLTVPNRKVMSGKLKKKKTMGGWIQSFFSGPKEA